MTPTMTNHDLSAPRYWKPIATFPRRLDGEIVLLLYEDRAYGGLEIRTGCNYLDHEYPRNVFFFYPDLWQPIDRNQGRVIYWHELPRHAWDEACEIEDCRPFPRPPRKAKS
jgi:hypothetical protein